MENECLQRNSSVNQKCNSSHKNGFDERKKEKRTKKEFIVWIIPVFSEQFSTEFAPFSVLSLKLRDGKTYARARFIGNSIPFHFICQPIDGNNCHSEAFRHRIETMQPVIKYATWMRHELSIIFAVEQFNWEFKSEQVRNLGQMWLHKMKLKLLVYHCHCWCCCAHNLSGSILPFDVSLHFSFVESVEMHLNSSCSKQKPNTVDWREVPIRWPT